MKEIVNLSSRNVQARKTITNFIYELLAGFVKHTKGS